MKRLLTLLVGLALFGISCSRDPNAVKRKFVESGNKYFQNGNYREASIMYRTALRKDPRFGEAYYREALAETELGQWGAAAAAFRRAVELMPESPSRVAARVGLADVCLTYLEIVERNKELIVEAGRIAEDLLALDPNSFDGHRIRGRVATVRAQQLGARLPDEAVAQRRRAVAELELADALRPLQPGVISALAAAYWSNQQLDLVEKLLTSAIDRDKALISAYSELYAFYLKVNRLDQAERILKLGLQNNPKHYLFAKDLAVLYQAQSRRTEMAATLAALTANAREFPEVFELAGELYLSAGDPAEALRCYEAGKRAQPGLRLPFEKREIAALIALNRRREAVALNEAILKENPGDVDALTRRAAFLLEDGNAVKAIDELEAILRRHPDHALGQLNLGRALLAVGRRQEAQMHFSEAVRQAPNLVPARLALAQLQLDTGEYGNAVITADAVLSLDGRNAAAVLLKASGLRSMGKFAESRAALKPLLGMHSGNDEALFQLGMLEESEHHAREAKEAYRKSFLANPANLRPLLALAEIHIQQHEGAKALQVVQDEVVKHPDNADLVFSFANLALRLDRPDQAIAQFERMAAAPVQNQVALARINQGLSAAYFRKGDLPAAVARQESAQRLAPADPMIQLNLANLYDATGRTKEAGQLYQRLVGMKDFPNAAGGVAMNNLAYYLANNGGDLDQALTLAQRAHQQLPGVPEFADTVGLIYLKKRLVDESLEVFGELVRKKPDNPVFHYHLGMALLEKGATAKAREEFRTALASKPSADDSNKIRELIAQDRRLAAN